MNLARWFERATVFAFVSLSALMARAEVQPEEGGVYMLPKDVSVEGHRIDWLLDITNLFALILFIIMCIWMGVAILKHNKQHKADYDHGNSKHSMVVALGISIFVFLVVDGNLFYHSVIDVSEVFWNWEKANAKGNQRVEILARQWAWQFRYPGPDDKFGTPDDIVTLNDLVVPENTPINAQLGAVDVIHSFYLPNLRAKMDAVPGMVNRVWFEAKETGEFDVACAQHCGTHHYKMKGKLTILSKEDFARWKKEAQINSALDYDEADSKSQWGWEWQEI